MLRLVKKLLEPKAADTILQCTKIVAGSRHAERGKLRYIGVMPHDSDSGLPLPGPIDHSDCTGHGKSLDGVKLTPARQALLDILCDEGKPLGAYDLIERMAARNGKRPAPISVYRVLDYLVENGLAHRLSSRNAFLACAHHHDAGEALAFLICDQCGSVSEQTSPELGAAVNALAASASFKRRMQVIELTGLCGQCRAS